MVDQSGRWYADWPGQQPWQDPAYVRAYGQGNYNNSMGQNANAREQMQGQQPSQQVKTVNIIAVNNQKEAEDFPVGLGSTQMMMARDDSFVAVKTVSVAGEPSFLIYDLRPPAPPAPKFDPAEYVRRDEADKMIMERVETLVSAALTAQKGAQRKQAQEVE